MAVFFQSAKKCWAVEPGNEAAYPHNCTIGTLHVTYVGEGHQLRIGL